MTHFNFTDETKPENVIDRDVIVRLPRDFVTQANHTFTASFGMLRPTTIKELWENLEGSDAWHETLAQYYFDLTGDDIAG